MTFEIRAWLLNAAVASWLVGAVGAQSGDEASEVAPAEVGQLADLSLEELMAIDMSNYTSVIGGHTHLSGEWMVGYRLMLMYMDGLREGSTQRSTADVLNDYMVAPTRMTMEMHMAELMYAPSDQFTFMVMAPFHKKSMRHITRMGGRFTTRSYGLGDISFTTFYTPFRTADEEVHFGLGLSLPTGSISERSPTPMGPNQKLPYPMQLGSGTWDLLPSVTYSGQTRSFGWGAQVRGTVRLGENADHYRLGDRLSAVVWGKKAIADWAGVTARVRGQVWENVHGADPELNPNMVPTADPDNLGGDRIDLMLGLSLFGTEDPLQGNRLNVEVGFPVYEHLDGPQLETDLLVNVSWQMTF